MPTQPRNTIWKFRYTPADLLAMTGVALVYAALAKVGLTLFSQNGNVTLVWPPSGVALATLLVGGTRYWPGVYLGALAANYATGNSLGVAMIIALGNTSEAVLAAWVLKRTIRIGEEFSSISDFLRFLVFSVILIPLVAALSGTTTLLLAGNIQRHEILGNIFTWWMGDGLGILLVTPLILTWRSPPRLWSSRKFEAALLLSVTFVAGQALFLNWFEDYIGKVHWPYWMFLLIAWAAIRLGAHGVTLVLVITSLQGLLGAVQGKGVFFEDLSRSQLSNLWFFTVILSIVGESLASAFKTLMDASYYSRSLIEASLDPLFTIDHSGKISDANHALESATGIPRVSLIGTDFWDYFTEPATARRMFQEAWRDGQQQDWQLELRNISGRTQNVLCNANLYRNEKGEPVGVFAAARNITSQKTYEKKLEQAMAAAEAANHAKSAFLASMSHEIRTPLNSVVGLTEVLLDSQLPPDQHRLVQVANAAGENLLLLINDILDISRIESGALTLEAIPFHLSEQIENAISIVNIRAHQKGLRITRYIDPVISDYRLGDPTRLRQVLLNLLANAVKFSERGEVSVRVASSASPDEPGHLHFSVSDEGIGIPRDKLETIFETFQQVDTSVTRRYGGSGLGLSIAKKLVGLMHGKIWVESEPDQGSTFHFTARLPKSATPESRPIEPRPATPVPATDEGLRALRILLVDDSEDNRFLMAETLKNTPHQLTEAENGLEAVELCQKQRFDLIFMDVQMPVMDGYTATREIRQLEKDNHLPAIPILALTAHVFEEDIQASLKAGCTEHISKPIRKATFLELLRKYSRASIQPETH